MPTRNETISSSAGFSPTLYCAGNIALDPPSFSWTYGRRSDDSLNPLGPWTYSPYDKPIGDHIGDTFDVLPDNTFLIKLNYAFLR